MIFLSWIYFPGEEIARHVMIILDKLRGVYANRLNDVAKL
jgi:hypothetical protein